MSAVPFLMEMGLEGKGRIRKSLLPTHKASQIFPAMGMYQLSEKVRGTYVCVSEKFLNGKAYKN